MALNQVWEVRIRLDFCGGWCFLGHVSIPVDIGLEMREHETVLLIGFHWVEPGWQSCGGFHQAMKTFDLRVNHHHHLFSPLMS